MKNALVLAALIVSTAMYCGAWDAGPVLHGTINVVVADQQGILVLTDSMITWTEPNAEGVRISRQQAEPGQKLFQIDNQTVCTFAGFASASTMPLPDFLNSVSAIMGRIPTELSKAQRPLSFSEKLELIEGVFRYYLTGIANIRESADGTYFELLLAGFDLDGVPKVGQLTLGTIAEAVPNGTFLNSVTLERKVSPITSAETQVFLHGKKTLAEQILNHPEAWKADKAVRDYENATKLHKAMTMPQMKALAIALKEHTAETDKEVGGPNQIAILTNGKIASLEQPHFPGLVPRNFEFEMTIGYMFDNSRMPGNPAGQAISFNGFGLIFANTFIHTNQPLDNGYFAHNNFTNCALYYRGGRLLFMDSNSVINTDLVLDPAVSKDSPFLRQLLTKFHWRTVKVGQWKCAVVCLQ